MPTPKKPKPKTVLACAQRGERLQVSGNLGGEGVGVAIFFFPPNSIFAKGV